MANTTLLDDRGQPLPSAIAQLGGKRNRHLRRGLRVQVTSGTRAVYIPRKKHYAPTVLTATDGPDEVATESYLEAFGDILEPCTERRDPIGWNRWHECSYHRVFIQQK
jgi:hypothetical protein